MIISTRLLDNGNYSPKSESNYYNALIETQYLENNKKMADVIRGTIQQVPKPREFVKGNQTTLYYSIKVNDVYYSVGSKKPPAEGTLVEFEAEKNARGYWDVTKAGVRIIPAGNPTSNVGNAAVAASGGSKTGNLNKEGYWDRKDERDVEWQRHQKEVVQPRIEIQAARNAAIEFVKLLITPVGVDKDGAPAVALKLPAAVAKREQVLFEAVQKYTQEFVNSNSSENNNKNEPRTQVKTSSLQQTETASNSKDSESVSSDDSAWNV